MPSIIACQAAFMIFRIYISYLTSIEDMLKKTQNNFVHLRIRDTFVNKICCVVKEMRKIQIRLEMETRKNSEFQRHDELPLSIHPILGLPIEPQILKTL